MIFDIFSLDSFNVLVTVLRSGQVMNMNGATLEASATNGVLSVSGTIDATLATSGRIGISFAAGTLSTGNWEIQMRATIGAETQTVARIFVRVSQAADVV